MKPTSVSLFNGQAAAIGILLRTQRYGSTRAEVMRYLISIGLQQFDNAGTFREIDAVLIDKPKVASA